ncbi:MAG: FumA C-terminus/TtdB family hydratase beta subunit [Oscillospiraceae bacterium]|jgi:fumarate hydratase subunit beta|nr:FumA C-terminus/TtdB family hydratase beta subunit [Oscillospiraceae bacterium]
MTFEINSSEIPHIRFTAGDRVYLSGRIYTARDAAHKQLLELTCRDEKLPFKISGASIYYAGPTPSKNGMPVGSCGPTTSGRMDSFTPKLLDMGLASMIGKGRRSPEVVEAIRRNNSVYFAATGGAGALIAKCVLSAKEIAFEELGCESIKELTVERLPLIVAIDAYGGNLFESEAAKFAAG